MNEFLLWAQTQSCRDRKQELLLRAISYIGERDRFHCIIASPGSWISAFSFRGRWCHVTTGVSHKLHFIGQLYNFAKGGLLDGTLTEPYVSNSIILSGPGVSQCLGAMGDHWILWVSWLSCFFWSKVYLLVRDDTVWDAMAMDKILCKTTDGGLSEVLLAGNLNMCLSLGGQTAAPLQGLMWFMCHQVAGSSPREWYHIKGSASISAVWHTAVANADSTLVRLSPCDWVHTHLLLCYNGCFVEQALGWLGKEADQSVGGSSSPPDYRETPPQCMLTVWIYIAHDYLHILSVLREAYPRDLF